MAMHEAMAMHPLGFGHGRYGSGTSWLPDANVARHLMTQAGSWTLMAHGAVFAGGIEGVGQAKNGCQSGYVLPLCEKQTAERPLSGAR